MRWVLIGCPCALGSLSLQPHTPLSHLVSSLCLHSFVFCAHTHTFALTLVLLASPREGVCVEPLESQGSIWIVSLKVFPMLVAGGTGGADETGANKHAHQLPVIQLETSNCVPAEF